MFIRSAASRALSAVSVCEKMNYTGSLGLIQATLSTGGQVVLPCIPPSEYRGILVVNVPQLCVSPV